MLLLKILVISGETKSEFDLIILTGILFCGVDSF